MDERADDDGRQGPAMKRRGILAAAGAAVAAIVAKQATQPVAALDPNDLALGTENATAATTRLTYTGPRLTAATSALLVAGSYGMGTSISAMLGGVAPSLTATTGVYGEGGDGGTNGMNGYGVYGRGYVGVFGYSSQGTGVLGQSTATGLVLGESGVNGVAVNGHAVLGQQLGDRNGLAGVFGDATGDSVFGVFGVCRSGAGVGVQGDSIGGTGMKGTSSTGFPVVGAIRSDFGGTANKAAGVLGSGIAGPGVQGQSTGSHGLVGTTDAADGHAGLIGNATSAGGIGLMGIAPGYGTQTVGDAAQFFGNVRIYGGVLSAPAIQSVARHSGDSTYRLLHCVEAAESWVEDVGESTLAGGTAEVTLDPDFAALIHTDAYHVFLTPYGPLQLHVAHRGATGFTVAVTPSGATGVGGVKRPTEGSGTFSWKVQAKRKDLPSERLVKVAGPNAPARPSPFPISETPVAMPPIRKP